jgi:ABC-type glycerol-3-phosphate transport system substrate-binding protein
VARASKRVLAGAAAGALLLLAGCGGGSSATTKAQYISKVNAICEEEKEVMHSVASQHVSIFVNLEESAKHAEETNAKIAAVVVPTTNPITPEWLAQRRAAVSASKRVAASKLRSAAIRTASREFASANRRAEMIAAAYGLASCKGFAGS